MDGLCKCHVFAKEQRSLLKLLNLLTLLTLLALASTGRHAWPCAFLPRLLLSTQNHPHTSRRASTYMHHILTTKGHSRGAFIQLLTMSSHQGCFWFQCDRKPGTMGSLHDVLCKLQLWAATRTLDEHRSQVRRASCQEASTGQQVGCPPCHEAVT